jgi:hypothetical protein
MVLGDRSGTRHPLHRAQRTRGHHIGMMTRDHDKALAALHDAAELLRMAQEAIRRAMPELRLDEHAVASRLLARGRELRHETDLFERDVRQHFCDERRRAAQTC